MILVTGSSGFIGSKLLPLIRKKYPKEVVTVLNKNNCNLVTGRGLSKLSGKPKIVFHLAATTDTSKRDQRCNDIGTKNLLKALPSLGPKTHFIYTSSQVVYSGRSDTGKLITSKTATATNNKYGKTKLMAEKILLRAAKEKGFKLTIIRLPTVWGENPRKNAFLNFLRKLTKKNSIFSRFDWPGKVALVYVEDAVKYILKAGEMHPQTISIAVENLTLAQIFEKNYINQGKIYKQIKVPNFVWSLARFLRPYLKYFEFILPTSLFNYLWRTSIIVDSPLACKVNIKGKKFAG